MFDAPVAPTATKKPRAPRKPKVTMLTAPVTEATAPVVASAPRFDVKGAELKRWAYCGVAGTLTLSAWLNSLAFSHTAPSPVHGWALGIAIPLLILVFSRVSALLWMRGRSHLALCGAAACLSMLALSVQHCACSIARLSGEPVGLAALMAIAIDVGLVVAELATVTKK